MAALFKNGIIADNVGDSLSDYDAFISAMEGLKEKSSVQKHGVQLVESELNALQMEYSKLGVFQVSAKKELKVAIDAEMKKKEIAEYDESLSRIESMFENRWKIMVEGVPLWFVIIFVIGLILYLLKSVFSGFLGDVASVQWYYECEIFRTTWLLPNREKHWFIEN